MKYFSFAVLLMTSLGLCVAVGAPPAAAAKKAKGKKAKTGAKAEKAKTVKDTSGGKESKPVPAAKKSPAEEAIEEVMGDLGFRSDINKCVKERIHPAAITLHLGVATGGMVHLVSIDPEPLYDVYQCISAAASKVNIGPIDQPVEDTYPVLLPYPYHHVKEGWGQYAPEQNKPYEPYTQPPKVQPPYPPPPPPPPPKPPRPKIPGSKMGGFGIYGSFVALDRGMNTWKLDNEPDVESLWYGKLSGGVGLFLEAMPNSKVSLGLELNLTFPFVDEIERSGEEKSECDFCRRDIFIRLLIRAKFPIMVAKKTSLYPIIVFGYSDYISRAENRVRLDFHGMTFGLGFGLENYRPRKLSPFLEVRYMFHAGWQKKDFNSEHYVSTDDQQLLNHNLAVHFGLRFP